jgi:flagellar biosynthesis protein FliP
METDVTQVIASLNLPWLGVLALVVLGLLLSAYVRIATVLSIIRIGISLPPALVTTGLALALTFFVMYPTVLKSAVKMESVLKGGDRGAPDVVRNQALSAGIEEWKVFVAAHTSKNDIEMFGRIASQIDHPQSTGIQSVPAVPSPSPTPPLAGELVAPTDQLQSPSTTDSTSWRLLAPAFLVSQLRAGFGIGLKLYLPFLVIDLIVAYLLAATGAEKLEPALVAIPLKIALFVAADGWALISSSIAANFGV